MQSTSYRYQTQAEAYQLEMVVSELPPLKSDEVLIEVKAVSLNYRDLTQLRNKAGRRVEGKIPCSDGAGVVISKGEHVHDFEPGDHVAGLFFQEWESGPFLMNYHQRALGGTVDGMLASHVILNRQGLIKLPSGLSFLEASCLPCAGLTAFYALKQRLHIQPGGTLLCLGTGGVSVFALQFGKALGLNVIMTSSDDQKLKRAEQLGATFTINYHHYPDWDKRIAELTQKEGVDYVIEVGGPGTLERSMNSIKAGGKIALIGVLTGFGPPPCSLFPLLAKNAELHGIYVGDKISFSSMLSFMTQHQIHPVIDRVYPFDEAATAFSYLESAQHFGKVVIEL